jgi:peptide-methionine (S)-S-oxide reductase
MFLINRRKMEMVRPEDALPGRSKPLPTAKTHFVTGIDLKSEVPEGMEQAMFGMGCFWGVERIFWQIPGVYVTMVGYAGGYTPNPTYQETCTQLTGHNEVVRVIFDPAVITFAELLTVFWENHDPTTGMRQGNDVGSTYRSGIYAYCKAQNDAAIASKATYGALLAKARYPAITTEILPVPTFYYAEDYHQQYLAKNPDGYCGIAGTGVACPIGLGVATPANA